MQPAIFTYLDYRQFLAAAFQAMGEREPNLSYRAFAKKAGYSTPNFLQQVIRGQRGLNLASLEGTVRALGLNRQEADFFRNLVGFEQSRSFWEKDSYYKKLKRNRRYSEAKPLEKSQYEYYSQWYNPVVRELLVHEDFDGSPDWITTRVFPRITSSQVEKSIALLLELGLVRFDEATGRHIQTERSITTSSEADFLGLVKFHKAMIGFAAEALENFPSDRRDIRSVTLSITPEGYEALKARLEVAWREVMESTSAEAPTSQVYQFNMQLFPLVKEGG